MNPAITRYLSSCSVALCLLAGSAGPAAAQTSGPPADRRSPYLRLFTGIGVTGDSNLRIRQPALGTDLVFEGVSWQHRSLSTDWSKDSIPYVGVRGGFFFHRPAWLSLSFEVLHFKVFAEEDKPFQVTGTDEGTPVDAVLPMSTFVQRYQVSNGVNMVLAHLHAHRGIWRSGRFPAGRVDFYAGAGAGVTVPFTRSVIDGQGRGQYEWGRPAIQWLGGLAWRVSPRWDISLEFKLTHTTADGAVADGHSETRLRTHHAALGIRYHFE